MAEGICGRHHVMNCHVCHAINLFNDSREYRRSVIAEDQLNWEERLHAQKLRDAQNQGLHDQPHGQQLPQSSVTQLAMPSIQQNPVSPTALSYQPQESDYNQTTNFIQQQMQQQLADQRKAHQQLLQSQIEHQIQLNQQEAEAAQARREQELDAGERRRQADAATTAAVAAKNYRIAQATRLAQQEMQDKADRRNREFEEQARYLAEAQRQQEEGIQAQVRETAKLKEQARFEEEKRKAEQDRIAQKKALEESKLRAAEALASQQLQATKNSLEAERLRDIEELERKKRDHDDWVAKERTEAQRRQQRDRQLLLQQRDEEDRRRAAESALDFQRRMEANAERRRQEQFEEERENQRARQRRIDEDRERENEMKQQIAKRNTATAQRQAALDQDHNAALFKIRNQTYDLERARILQQREFEEAFKKQEEFNRQQQRNLAEATSRAIADRARARTPLNQSRGPERTAISDVSHETMVERIRTAARAKNTLRLNAEKERDKRLSEERISNAGQIKRPKTTATSPPRIDPLVSASALMNQNEERRREAEAKDKLRILQRLQAVKTPLSSAIASPINKPVSTSSSDEERARLATIEKLRRVVANSKSPPGSTQLGFSTTRPASTGPAYQPSPLVNCRHGTKARLCDICSAIEVWVRWD